MKCRAGRTLTHGQEYQSIQSEPIGWQRLSCKLVRAKPSCACWSEHHFARASRMYQEDQAPSLCAIATPSPAPDPHTHGRAKPSHVDDFFCPSVSE